MEHYSRVYSPPAPVVTVTLFDAVTGSERAKLEAKLDTGADVTVLPESVIAQLALVPRAKAVLRGFDGRASTRLVYYVGMRVMGVTLPAVRCVTATRTGALLGRNVLNRFVITLDGPGLVLEIVTP